MITSHFPTAGQKLIVFRNDDVGDTSDHVGGVLKGGVCFKVSKPNASYQAYGVLFVDGFWLGYGPAPGQDHIPCKPWAPHPEPERVKVASAFFSLQTQLPEGFMCDASVFGQWTLFQQYRHPWHKWPEENGKEENAILEARWYCPKEKWRLPPLQAGDIVDCRGKVVSSGNTGGLGLTFVAWAQGYKGVTAPQLANYAIVALPSGELTWAALAGREEGYISRPSPPRTASSEKLEVYRAMLPEFLGESTASNVNSLLMRTLDPNVPDPMARQAAAKERAAQLRSASRGLARQRAEDDGSAAGGSVAGGSVAGGSEGGGSEGGGTPGGGTPGGGSEGGSNCRPRRGSSLPGPKPAPTATAIEVMHPELMRVTKSFLQKLPVPQLQALCTDKCITFDMATDPTVGLTLTLTLTL